MRLSFLAAIAALGLAATPALAHPKLVSATPAANASVGAASRVQLAFSEKLMAKFSGADVAMTGMGGMEHAPMKIAAKSAIGADGKTLVLTFAKPLAKGSYRVDWHVVTADTHRVTGTYNFTVA